MDTIERSEWLYTQSDDAVVAEFCMLEAELAALKEARYELVRPEPEPEIIEKCPKCGGAMQCRDCDYRTP